MDASHQAFGINDEAILQSVFLRHPNKGAAIANAT
jgi:hypothetical protein